MPFFRSAQSSSAMVGQECRLGSADKYSTRSSRQPSYPFPDRDSSGRRSDLHSVTSSVLTSDRSSSGGRGRNSNNDVRSSIADYFSDDGSGYLSDDDKTSASQAKRQKRKCYVWMMAIYMFAAAVTFFTVLLWRMGFIFSGYESNLKSSMTDNAGKQGYDSEGNMICNGLASNCNRRANEIMYATVHNAMSSREDKFLAFNNLFPLEDALMAGFRGLTLDSCDCTRIGIQLCHGICVAGFRRPAATFQAIVDFMTQNPHEVIIIELQIMADSLGPLFEALKEVEGLADLMYQHPPGTGELPSRINEPWPKLKDLILMDKRLIIFQHDGPDCDKGQCPPGVHNTYTYMFETPFQQKGATELMDVDSTCTVNRGWSNADFVISNHFASDDNGLPDYDISAIVNNAQRVETRLDSCLKKFRRETINLLVVDFWNVGDVLQVVQEFNSELTPITEAPSAAPSFMPTTSPQPSAAPTVDTAEIPVNDLLETPAPSPKPTTTSSTGIPSPSPTSVPSPEPTATLLMTAEPSVSFDSFFDNVMDDPVSSGYEATTSPTSPSFPAFNTANNFQDQNTATEIPTASPTIDTIEDFTSSPTNTPTEYPTWDFYASPPTAIPTETPSVAVYSPPTVTPTLAVEESIYYEPTATPSKAASEVSLSDLYESNPNPTTPGINVINGDPPVDNTINDEPTASPTFNSEMDPLLAEEEETPQDWPSSGHAVFVPEKDTPGQP